MIQIQTLNAISPVYRDSLPEGEYDVRADAGTSSGACWCAAQIYTKCPSGTKLLCIGRAGAGVNNIPLDKMAEKGVVVFNSPGARTPTPSRSWSSPACCSPRAESPTAWSGARPSPAEPDMEKLVEKGKSRFAGPELSGKTLGVDRPGRHRRAGGQHGRGAGHGRARLRSLHLRGSRVEALPRRAPFHETLAEVLEKSDYLTLHVPLMDCHARHHRRGRRSRRMKPTRGAAELRPRPDWWTRPPSATALEAGPAARLCYRFPVARS